MNKVVLKRTLIFAAVLLLLVGLTACAPKGSSSEVYGFWGGLWHGLIFSFALIGKVISWLLHLINSNWGDWNIGLWADNNTGFTYWLGFFISIFFFGGGTMAFRRLR